MIEAEPWGAWRYDRTPGNELLNPEDLLDCLAYAQANPHEIRRHAYIALELSEHAELDESTRQTYLQQATAQYELLANRSGVHADLTDYFTYAFLPLRGDQTRTSRKKANREVTSRSRVYAAIIEKHFAVDAGVARGSAAELLAATAARQEGYSAQPSLYRQDNAIPLVEGKRYSWDVSLADTGSDPEATHPARMQVKHRDHHNGKADYHNAITVHRVFDPGEHYNPTSPRIITLLHAALQTDGSADIKGYRKYRQRLARDVESAAT